MQGSRTRRLLTLLMLPLLAGCLPTNATPNGTANASPNASPNAIPGPTTRRYVRADAPPGGDGRSWSGAFGFLQDAFACLDSAACAGVTEVWVAAGSYYPDDGGSATDGDRGASFRLREGVQLLGGFAGTETSPDQRNGSADASILSGDIDQDDEDGDGNGVAESWEDIRGGNSYHVVAGDGLIDSITGATGLDGFTITAGQADGEGDAGTGGGFMCSVAADGEFTENTCSPSLRNIVFVGNTAGTGGAVYHLSSWGGISSPAFEDVVFRGNRAGGGGAMGNRASYSGSSSPTVRRGEFTGNSAGLGGAVVNDTGVGGSSSPEFYDVAFTQNVATGSGGAVADVSGRGGRSSPLFTRVTFLANRAAQGGAIYNSSFESTSDPVGLDVLFLGNVAEQEGGAVCNVASSPGFSNAVFAGNRATHGGAMANLSAGNDVVGSAGPTAPRLVNATLAGNVASGSGGALYNLGDVYGGNEPSLANAIVWGNTAAVGDQLFAAFSSVGIASSLVEGGLAGPGVVIGEAGRVSDDGGNVTGDPSFRDATGDDGVAGTADDDLRLARGSAAADAGSDAAVPAEVDTDLDGNPRIVGNAVDLGAYELQ